MSAARYVRLVALLAALAVNLLPVAAGEVENPVLAGFYPDPSSCRVGDDYYLVTTTFEYFPGVPIFHSKDLVNWRQLGHVLTRQSQLPLEKMRASGGIFAPTLRWHDGTFYLITTNVWGGGNFYVTAKDPAGPWSEPVWIDQEGIDPSLMFDDDGTVYYTRHVGGGDGYIGQRTLNLATGKLEGELQNIWAGTGGVWAEGPHLYKVNGKYYLMISEGGTSYDHAVTVARSDSPWGPFESNPDNPVLTHRGRPELPIQAVGHADLVETPAGWWAVCLGIRPQGGNFHHLGRETFLTPARWNEHGWLELGANKTVDLQLSGPQLPTAPVEPAPERDEFDSAELALCWNYLRNPREENYVLADGKLRLLGSAVTLSDVDSPTFVGRRQTALGCEVSASLDFEPTADNEEAGLVVRGNDENYYTLGVTHDGGRQVFLRTRRKGKLEEPVRRAPLAGGKVVLTIVAGPLEYEFFYQNGAGERVSLGTALTRDLSSEIIGGFTGAYLGMYATGNGQTCDVPADFDWFEYRITDR